MSEKILIIGKGFLGGSIALTATELGINVIGTHYHTRDVWIYVTNIDSIEKVISNNNPDFIINCAGLVNLNQIESNPENAYEVNAYGAKNVALVAHKKKIKLIHISTDSVFSGKNGLYTEEDEPHPINQYAKSKKMGEDFVSNSMDRFVIVRTNFYGFNGQGNFLFNWILNNLQNKINFKGFTDVIFNPLEIKNLATMIIELLHLDFVGILHLSSDEILSKYQFATTIAKTLGFDSELIRKGSVNDVQFTAERPLNTSLSNLKAKKLLKTKPLSLHEWLNIRKAFLLKTCAKN